MSGWTADGAAIGFGDGSDWEFTDDHMAAERIVARHNDALAEAERQRDDALAKIARVRSLAEVVARLQPADPDTHDRDVSWLALLDALDPDDAALADPEPTP